MARNVRAVTSGLGMAHQHSSSNVIGSRTTVACMGIRMAAAAILFLPHLWLSGCLGGRFPEPYYHLDNRHSENYDPRFWLTPYEYPIDAYYYPEDYVDMNYSSNDGYPQDPYLTRRRFDEPWWNRGGEPWYYPTRPTRVRLGQGRYRLLNPSDAELNCDFPDSEHIISNVVWVRADLAEPDVRSLYRLHKERGRDAYSKVTGHLRGSTLYLHRVTPLDTGLYRCLATSRGPGGRVQTVFQDVHFVPDIWHNHRP